MNITTQFNHSPILKGTERRNVLWAVTTAALLTLVLTLSASCGPSDEELAAMVAAEVERQVALVPPAPQGDRGPDGPQGPQGVEGPQGLVGPVGPQGLTGPQGPQGATGPQGRVGPAGSVGVQGPKGDPGLQGPPGQAGRDGTAVGIPKVLEVEELIVRSSDGTQHLRLRAGTEGFTASIQWVSTQDGTVDTQMYGGSTRGMVLKNRNDDNSSWTEFCIDEGAARIC